MKRFWERLALHSAYVRGHTAGMVEYEKGSCEECPFTEPLEVSRWKDGVSDGWDDAYHNDYADCI